MEKKLCPGGGCTILLVWLWLFFCSSFALAAPVALQLTPRESSWLSQQQSITIAVMQNWPPMDYVDEDGAVTGIGVDYLNAINERIGGIIKIVPAPFSENVKAVQSRQLDALMDITPKPDRELFFNFTPAYMTIPQVIVARKTTPYLRNEKDLADKTVALEHGYYTIQRFQRDYPAIKIREYATTSDCLDAVARGEVDAYVGNRAVAMFVIEEELLANLAVMGRTSEPPVSLTIGTHKDNKELAAILTKALNSLSVQERHAIHRKWLEKTQPNEDLHLSAAEQLWLQQHPRIRFGIGESWAPFVFPRKNGSVAGFDADWLEKINALIGANIQLVPGPWHEMVRQAENRELDGLAESAAVASRRQFFEFTDPYISQYYALATTHELKHTISSAADLEHKVFAYTKGNAWVAELIQSIGPVTSIETQSEAESFNLVLAGKADAAMVTLGMYSELRKSYFDSLVIAYVFARQKLDLVYSVRNDWPQLVAILNKALAVLGETQQKELLDKWIGYQVDELTEPLALSTDELAWLELGQAVTVQTEDTPPLFILNKDKPPAGIAVDYLNYIARRTGITFKYVADNQPHDLSATCPVTEKRQKSSLFSQPYYSSPRVIYALQENCSVVGMEALEGRTVACVDGSAEHDALVAHYPEITLLLVDSASDALKAVATSRADAFIGNLTLGNYLIDREGYSNLRIAGPSALGAEQLTFSTRRDLPQLAGIIDTVLAQMSYKEQAEIRSRYLDFKYDYGISRARIEKWVLRSAVAVAVVIALFILWNRSLARLVKERTAQLKKTNRDLVDEIEERRCAEEKHRQLEAQLRQKVKAEAVGVMAAGIAHNFNNNLSIILGNVELSKMKLPADSPIAELMDNSRIAVLRARDLVRQILTYSREGDNHQQPVALHLVIDETVKLLQATIPRSVTLQLEIHEDVKSCLVMADASQIQEVVLNLCNNAVHAMHEKGLLQIMVQKVAVSADMIPIGSRCAPGEYIRLSIQDNGCGISPEILDKIFDPFFTTKAIDEGTGLGLSTVDGIVEQHHAFLHVDSALSQGSTFSIYFPLVTATLAAPAAPEHANTTKHARILFVDDDEMLADIWSKILAAAGYEVTAETNSRKALDLLTADPDRFDLLITDQTMPDFTGIDLVQAVGKIRPELPSIICSGYSSKIGEQNYRDFGIKAFCQKPLDRTELLLHISQALKAAHFRRHQYPQS